MKSSLCAKVRQTRLATLCCTTVLFLTTVKLSFNGRFVRDTLLVVASEIRNCTASRCVVDAKTLALSSLCCCVFSPPSLSVCIDPHRLDHFVRTAHVVVVTRSLCFLSFSCGPVFSFSRSVSFARSPVGSSYHACSVLISSSLSFLQPCRC